ncbi:MAG: hypothetical protein QOJ50_2134, partial [Cryptosporangiaceae bacterium]|nr:hypothetical protein [Cryptosporangiaceae bacterium]
SDIEYLTGLPKNSGLEFCESIDILG